MGWAPNCQIPIQKSALLLCQTLVKDMANISTTCIRPERMASISDTLLNRKKVGARCSGPGHR